jgi:DNA-directed RNA polymerase subunit RPC12/RpoP
MKLKPCPFCGGEAYLASNCYAQNYVRCPNCGATVWGKTVFLTREDALKALKG